MKSALVFIDGTICDDRQRIPLLGTSSFYGEPAILSDKPVSGSVVFLNELSAKYNIIYIGSRPSALWSVTQKWLEKNNFPHGEIFLAPTQEERLRIAKETLFDRDIVLGIGDRWDDNQLHLLIGCKSMIVEEYNGDWNFISNYL